MNMVIEQLKRERCCLVQITSFRQQFKNLTLSLLLNYVVYIDFTYICIVSTFISRNVNKHEYGDKYLCNMQYISTFTLWNECNHSLVNCFVVKDIKKKNYTSFGTLSIN